MKKAELQEILTRNASSQAKLAKRLDIKVATVNKWMQRGKVPYFAARYLRLVDAMGGLKESK